MEKSDGVVNRINLLKFFIEKGLFSYEEAMITADKCCGRFELSERLNGDLIFGAPDDHVFRQAAGLAVREAMRKFHAMEKVGYEGWKNSEWPGARGTAPAIEVIHERLIAEIQDATERLDTDDIINYAIMLRFHRQRAAK